MRDVSSDVNDRDEDERTDPHIVAPKTGPASAAPARPSFPQRTLPGAGVAPVGVARTAAPRTTEPPRPPILPLRPAASSPPAASLGSDRASDVPPTSSLTAAMLIPRPSSPPPQMAAAGRVSDPGAAGDPLRERLAQVEVSTAATRSIASRVETEASRAHARLDGLDPRLASIESSVRERTAQLEATFEAARKSLEARVDDLLSTGGRPTMPALVEDPTEVGSLKTTVATLRATVAEHDRRFEARRARLDSLETRVAAAESDARLVELRRAVEGFDLRLRALERAQEALRSDLDARMAAMEARVAEGPITGTTKKAAAPEAELRRIKGVGPKYEKALRELGVTTLAQVAAMGEDDIAKVAAALAVPVERIRKLGWPEIARSLIAAE